MKTATTVHIVNDEHGRPYFRIRIEDDENYEGHAPMADPLNAIDYADMVERAKTFAYWHGFSFNNSHVQDKRKGEQS